MAIVKKHNLYVVEDAAEAHGAEYKGRKVGSFSDIACFSFFGNKIITTGEGGMCLTDNEHLAENMRKLRDHGMNPDRKYWHDVVGFNYRMTNMQAAIGVAQIDKLEKIVVRKREIAGSYDSLFCNVSGIALSKEMLWARHVYWMYSILVQDDFGVNRDELMNKLQLEGIENRPIFYPVHIMPPYDKHQKFPVAEDISRRGISLPSPVNLTTEQIEYIVGIIAGVKS
jgi:perosamine synthetase